MLTHFNSSSTHQQHISRIYKLRGKMFPTSTCKMTDLKETVDKLICFGIPGTISSNAHQTESLRKMY
jgi:hypothetical protein